MSVEIKRQFFETIKNGKTPEGCSNLLIDILPKKLYKYFRPNENAVNSLINQYLWHSAPNQLNDPYDSQLGWLGEVAIGDNYFFQAINRSLATGLKICSLSEVNDSILMWGHYALDHRGFCVEYDFTDSSWAPFPMQLYPIHYTNDILDLKLCYSSGLNLYNIAILASIAKYTGWEYEHEWRLFMWDTIITNKIPSPPPTAIYFGAKSNMDDLFIKQAREFALTKKIKQHRMELAFDKFELNPKILKV